MTDLSDNDEERQCPGCGLSERLWPKPGVIATNGEMFCCRDCAEGRVCSCAPLEHSPHIPQGP